MERLLRKLKLERKDSALITHPASMTPPNHRFSPLLILHDVTHYSRPTWLNAIILMYRGTVVERLK